MDQDMIDIAPKSDENVTEVPSIDIGSTQTSNTSSTDVAQEGPSLTEPLKYPIVTTHQDEIMTEPVIVGDRLVDVPPQNSHVHHIEASGYQSEFNLLMEKVNEAEDIFKQGLISADHFRSFLIRNEITNYENFRMLFESDAKVKELNECVTATITAIDKCFINPPIIPTHQQSNLD